VDVLNCNLEAIETSCFGDRDFSGEVAAQIFIDDSIRGSKECKDVRDEVRFSVGQSDPVREVCSKVNLFCCPEGSFGLLVHPPDVVMVDGEEYEAVWIFL
jgi:hypothetical protein